VNGKRVFVGIAPRSSVGAWLAGAGHDRMVGVSAHYMRMTRTGGAARDVTAPAAQDFGLITIGGVGLGRRHGGSSDFPGDGAGLIGGPPVEHAPPEPTVTASS
jgi:hypothetical protein